MDLSFSCYRYTFIHTIYIYTYHVYIFYCIYIMYCIHNIHIYIYRYCVLNIYSVTACQLSLCCFQPREVKSLSSQLSVLTRASAVCVPDCSICVGPIEVMHSWGIKLYDFYYIYTLCYTYNTHTYPPNHFWMGWRRTLVASSTTDHRVAYFAWKKGWKRLRFRHFRLSAAGARYPSVASISSP